MKRFAILCMLMLVLTSVFSQFRFNGRESVMIEKSDTLNVRGLDSLIITDTLSHDIKNDWITSFSITRKREMLYKYIYIKRLGKNKEIIYTLNQYQDTLFILSKRITKQQ